MAIHWKLKTYLRNKHSVYTAVELQKKIIKETGIIISLQNICNYLSRSQKPKMIRLKTIEVICSALNCRLNDFCDITPAKMNPEKRKKLSYKNTPLSKIGIKNFPDPEEYK